MMSRNLGQHLSSLHTIVCLRCVRCLLETDASLASFVPHNQHLTDRLLRQVLPGVEE